MLQQLTSHLSWTSMLNDWSLIFLNSWCSALWRPWGIFLQCYSPFRTMIHSCVLCIKLSHHTDPVACSYHVKSWITHYICISSLCTKVILPVLCLPSTMLWICHFIYCLPFFTCVFSDHHPDLYNYSTWPVLETTKFCLSSHETKNNPYFVDRTLVAISSISSLNLCSE